MSGSTQFARCNDPARMARRPLLCDVCGQPFDDGEEMVVSDETPGETHVYCWPCLEDKHERPNA